MKNILTILYYTIRETISKKIVLTIFIISTLTLAGFAISFSLLPINSLIHIKDQLSEEIILTATRVMESGLMSTIYGIGLFLSIFATAAIVPDLMKKGNIDLFLSKPISRNQLIVGKYLGALTVVFLNLSYLIISLWLMIGLKFEVWDTNFLYSIFSITYIFSILYALMIMISVFTKGSILSMVLSYIIYIILSPLLAQKDFYYTLSDSIFLKGLLETLYYILPNTEGMRKATSNLITAQANVDMSSFYFGAILLVIYFGVSLISFRKKDF